jgi:hypothetical protein
MNNEFESSDGKQNIAQGDHAVGKQVNNYEIPLDFVITYVEKLDSAEFTSEDLDKIKELWQQSKVKEKRLSIEYIHFLIAKSKKNKSIILISICILFVVNFIYQIVLLHAIFILSFLLLFISAKEKLIEYRIRKGLFGTNRTEARELIDFIIKNSDNLDFTDSNGNLRRALLPEAADAAEERIPGILGEEAPA